MTSFKAELQVLNPRDRVQLELELPTDTYAPGDDVRGVLNVTVRKTVEVTAIRIHLIGKEKCDVGGERKAVDKEFVHLERLVTVFGFSKGSKRRTGAELAEGTYAYPFSLSIPVEAPPSYAMQLPRKSSFFSRLTYKLTAVAVIPYNVDRTLQRELTVLSVVPKSEYLKYADKVSTLPKTELELVKGDSCCSVKHREFIEVSATTHPYILLVPTDETMKRSVCSSSSLAAGLAETAIMTDTTEPAASPSPTHTRPVAAQSPATTVARPVNNSAYDPDTFDSARKGGSAAPRPSAPEPSASNFDSARKGSSGSGLTSSAQPTSSMQFDSARKGDYPYNDDRQAVGPVGSGTMPPYGSQADQAPVTHWMNNGTTPGQPTAQNLHLNHTSALSEAERIAARELAVSVNIFNSTDADVTFFRIALVQHRSTSSGGATEEAHQVVYTQDVMPSPPLHPGERRTFDERLTFAGPMRTHEDKEKKTVTLPVPSMSTNMMRSGDTELTVSFPKMKNLAGLAMMTKVCLFASDVSTNEKLPPVPARYAQPFLFPEVAESGI